ncbi:MAG TPA: CxxxxCH/CxxCH domain-containing protein [Anaeromyxobacteraceae bacterium]|nr:CxxxxCH/CxxCH domain-containing protein [Anaeromyxobacteraceae bacterium]
MTNPTPARLAVIGALLALGACAKSREAPPPSSVQVDACVMCHGTVGRVGNLPGTDPLLAASPPAAPAGKPGAVVGAHQAHLNPPLQAPLRAPLPCTECHVVPTSLTHATNPPPSPVAFGDLARAGGASPTYDPVSFGCAAVYCHGNFDYNGVKGKAASVTWNGGTVGCGDCHALPPTGHPPLAGTVTRATCSQCHPSTVNPDGTINVNGGGHVNGRADVAFDCTTCHGTAGRTGFQQGTDPQLASAPPVAPPGAPGYAVGAHQSHLNPPLAGSVRGPLPCAECHVVPSDVSHATNPPAQRVVFGTLANTQGAAPTWTPTTTGCAATYCHGNFTFGAVTGANATPTWTGAAVTCVSCHGMPPTGHPAVGSTPATCATCHPASVNPDGTINLAGGGHLNGHADVVLDCTSCHGTAGRQGIQPGTDPQLASAPPAAPAGSPSAVVGAHLSHLNPPATGSFRGPVACAECHAVPADAGHATNPPAQTVVFGTLATNRGAAPSFDATTLGCAATYCHGNFTFGSVTGANATIAWSAAGLTCVSCHGMPPTGHPAVGSTAAGCRECHPNTVNADGTINLATGAHLNGQSDVAISCTSCHGTAGRTGNLAGTDPQLPAAPPIATAGNPNGTGAHQRHVNPTSANALRAPLLCNECHVVPADSTHATNPPASPVTFGTLSKTQGNSPSFNTATLGCNAVYCHGNFDYNGVRGNAGAPVWTDTGIQCVNCHGLPPTGHPALAGTVTATTCNGCHPSTVNPDGTINVAGGGHVNGRADVSAGCTSCHGDATRSNTAVNPLLSSAPPVAPPGTDPARVVGTHLLHLQDGAIRAGVACNNCHVVPADPDHSIQFPPRIVFSPGTLATTQSAAPTYDATSLSCSATYCHGNFAFGAVRGNGTGPTPAWNATPALSCSGCHGMPPTGHPALTGTVTAATCNQCHPATVKADGTIDVAGGKHMDGLAEVSGNPHTGDPLWADPTHHGYSANTQGLQNCTGCHVSFGSPAGTTGGSCNDCHTTAGFATWQTTCTFCHGTPGRTGTVAGTDAQVAAAPPVGPQGQTATTDRAVGAHQRHVNPPATGRAAAPFACTSCHPGPLPANVDHVNGQATPVPFGGIAITGNVTPTYNPTTLSCSATYCHGNFTNGNASALPTWTGAPVTCTSCHAMPTTSTGRHSTHMSKAESNCGNCHNGIATGTGNPSTNATITGPTLHVNGTKNVALGGTYGSSVTLTGTFNPTTQNCSATYCHGNFTGGNGATNVTPAWTTTATLACNACHLMPNNTTTGRHGTHSGSSFSCADCHNGIATSTGTSNATIVGPSLHVNGVKNVIIAPGNAITVGSSNGRVTCSGNCHNQPHGYSW